MATNYAKDALHTSINELKRLEKVKEVKSKPIKPIKPKIAKPSRMYQRNIAIAAPKIPKLKIHLGGI